MSEPKFVPPLRFDVLKAIKTGQLQGIDVAVYGYLVAHKDWRPVPADIAKFFGVSPRTAERAMQRLADAGLMVKGRGSRDRAKVRHPQVTRRGVYQPDVIHDMSSVTELHNKEDTQLHEERTSPVTSNPSGPLPRASNRTSPVTSNAPESSPKAFQCPSDRCPKAFASFDAIRHHVWDDHYVLYASWFPKMKTEGYAS